MIMSNRAITLLIAIGATLLPFCSSAPTGSWYVNEKRGRHPSGRWGGGSFHHLLSRMGHRHVLGGMDVTRKAGGGAIVMQLRGGGFEELRATVELVRRALEVLHDPTQDNNSRRAAQEHCDRVKSHIGVGEGSWRDSLNLCKRLVDSEMLETVRHYGFQLLDHLSTKCWASLQDTERTELKQYVMVLLQGGTREITEEKRFIKEKAVQVVSRLVRNDWPPRWPDALSTIRSLTVQGDTQCELALLVLKALPDDVYAEGVSVVRRNEMLQALHHDMPSLLSYLAEMLSAVVRRPPNSGSRLLLLEALCGCFEAYANIATSHAMAECGAAATLHSLLTDARLRLRAADALLAIVSKKSRAEPGGKSATERSMNGLAGQLLGTCASLGSCRDADDYKFTKRVVQVVCELGINHASILSAYPDTAASYMKLMSGLASHPCVRIPAMTLSFWGSLVEAQRNARGSNPPPCLSAENRAAFVGLWIRRMVSPQMSELDEIEFVDEEEWKAAVAASTIRFLDILRKLTAEQPKDMLLQVGGMWQEALMSHGACQTAAHGSGSVSVAKLDALHRALEKVVDAIPPHLMGEGFAALQKPGGTALGDPEDRASITSACTEIIRGLLESAWDANPEVACTVVKTIGFFAIYLQHADEQQLFFTFHRLLTLVGAKPQEGDAHRAGRRAAANVLLRIASTSAHRLAPHLGELAKVVGGLLDGAGVEERGQLAEMLFVVSTGLDSQDAQARFIAQALDDLCTGMSAEGWDLPAGFLECCFGTTSGTQDAEQEAKRAKALNTLQALASLLRRVTQSEGSDDGAGADKPRPYSQTLTAYAPRILEHLVRVVTAMHSFWQPHIQSRVTKRWAGVYYAVELKAVVDPSHKPSLLDCGDPAVTEACSWLRHVRDSAYESLSLLCDTGSFVHEAAAGGVGGVLEAVGSQWDCIENRHLRQLLRVFLTPFITKCPARLHVPLLGKILPPLFGQAFNRLAAGYAAMDSDAGRGGHEDEVMHDTAVRMLHREILDLVLLVSNTAVETGLMEGGGFSSGGVGDASAFLLGCEGASREVVGILANSLVWPDSIGSGKSVEAVQRLLLSRPGRLSAADRAVVCGVMVDKALTGMKVAETKDLFLALVTDIFTTFGKEEQAVGQRIANSVAMSSVELDGLRKYYFAEGRKEKEQRARMREVLSPLLRRDPPHVVSF